MKTRRRFVLPPAAAALGLVILASVAVVHAQEAAPRGDISGAPVVGTETLQTIVQRISAEKLEVLWRHRELIEERYNLNDRAAGEVSVSGAKPAPLRGLMDSPPYLHHGWLSTLENTAELFNVELGAELKVETRQSPTALLRCYSIRKRTKPCQE